jgi:4-amino-4-deoxy-L-arabinose transferase-like glycosyltransferase
MQQRQYINPALAMRGRGILQRARHLERSRKLLPLFWAARDTLGAIILIPLFFWVRLPKLLALPMFYDEAIYLQYARAYLADPQRNLLISAEKDGKPPLFIWGLAWFWNVLGDPLLGGRFMSLLGGALAGIFIYLTGRKLLSPMVGWVAAFFYCLSPIFVLHNRLAVHSSWESAAGMGALFFSVALGKRPRAMYALGLAAAIGLGLLIKQTAYFYLGLAPLAMFMMRRHPEVAARLAKPEVGPLRRFSLWWYKMRLPRIPAFYRPWLAVGRSFFVERECTTFWDVTAEYKQGRKQARKLKWRSWIYFFIVAVVAMALAAAFYLPLRTHPDSYLLSSTDTSYALSLDEVLALPLNLWQHSLSETANWYLIYYNIPILLLALASVGYAFLRPKKAQAEMLLLAWAVLPVIAQIILARQHWFSRYVVAFGPPVLLLAALALVRLSHYLIFVSRTRLRWTGAFGVGVCAIICVISVAPFLKIDNDLVNDPAQAAIATKDRWQYIEGWPSGYGIPETINYVRELAAQDPVLLYIDQTDTSPEYYFLYYLDHLKGWIFYARTAGANWNTHNFYYERTSYYITTGKPNPDLMPYLELKKVFSKPNGQAALAIYHFIQPQNTPEITVGN